MRINLLITLFFCFLFPLKTTFSQTYFIKYGVKDCASCNYFLDFLSKELDGRAVNIVFPSRFVADSSLLVQQAGLRKFNYNLVFDDSTYRHIEKGEESYFIAVNNDKTFKTKLKDFDVLGVQALLKTSKSATALTKQVCTVVKNSDDMFVLINDSTLISSSQTLNRVSYHNLSDGSVIEIIPDTNWTKIAYQKYYGAQAYPTKFDIYLKILEDAPTMMPATIAHYLKEGDFLYFYTDIKTWEYRDSILDDVSVNSVMAMFIYDISSKKIINCHIIPEVKDSNEYHISNISKFIKSNDTFYFHIMESYPTDSTKVLARYTMRGEELVFDKILDFTISQNYIKYQIGNHFGTCISNGHVFSFILSDKIYDLSTGKMVQLPINEETYDSLDGLLEAAFKSMQEGGASDKNYYKISSIADKGTAYGAIYVDHTNNLFEVLFDKTTGEIKRKQKIPINNSEIWGISYHPQNSNKMVYFDKNVMDGCMHIINLE